RNNQDPRSSSYYLQLCVEVTVNCQIRKSLLQQRSYPHVAFRYLTAKRVGVQHEIAESSFPADREERVPQILGCNSKRDSRKARMGRRARGITRGQRSHAHTEGVSLND